jgi:hypothetical protein
MAVKIEELTEKMRA